MTIAKYALVSLFAVTGLARAALVPLPEGNPAYDLQTKGWSFASTGDPRLDTNSQHILWGYDNDPTNNSGTVTMTMVTTPGQRYTVGFDAGAFRANPVRDKDASFLVRAGVTTYNPQGQQNVVASSAKDYTVTFLGGKQRIEFTFDAVGYRGQNTLSYLNIDARLPWLNNDLGDRGALSNFKFSQTPLAVPEPSTYTLMGVGLLTVGAVARRRRA